MNVKRFLGKCRAALDVILLNAQPSYSQVGEDIIIQYLFKELGLKKPSYLEIGTNLPVRGNNTYSFYKNGCSGVCVEPDPSLYKLVVQKRPNDIVLNVGIGLSNSTSETLYIFPEGYTGWNTFSAEEAKIREKDSGIMVHRSAIIELRNINDIMHEYFNPHPNFISIDVEGLDLEILRSIDFSKYRPEVFCVETITFSTRNKGQKITQIIDYLHSMGYFTYADTYVNTIFCRKDLFNG